MAKLNQPRFRKRIIKSDRLSDSNYSIITLECNHQWKIFNEEFTVDGKWLCSECISEYLVQKNKEINEHFKSPIVKPFPEE